MRDQIAVEHPRPDLDVAYRADNPDKLDKLIENEARYLVVSMRAFAYGLGPGIDEYGTSTRVLERALEMFKNPQS